MAMQGDDHAMPLRLSSPNAHIGCGSWTQTGSRTDPTGLRGLWCRLLQARRDADPVDIKSSKTRSRKGKLDSAQGHGAQDEHLRLPQPLLFVLDILQRRRAVQLVVFGNLRPICGFGDLLVGEWHRCAFHALRKMFPDVVGGRWLRSVIGGVEDLDYNDVLDFGRDSIAAVGL